MAVKVGAVILAGGQGRRMGGVVKAELTLGGSTFLASILGALSGFDEVLLSVDSPQRFPGCTVPMVADVFTGCGPMAGLHAALGVCQSDALLAVSCDMPLFNHQLAHCLAAAFDADVDAAVAVTRNGGIHPLCGVYHKRTMPVLERLLKDGERRMMSLLEQLRVRWVPLAETPCADSEVANINTPQELRRLELLCGKGRQAVDKESGGGL